MQQTALTRIANEPLLSLIPEGAHRIVEVGCSGGGMAREFRKAHPACEYVGIEIDAHYAEVSREHCTRVLVGDIEKMSDAVFDSLFPADCWIFGDVLEHLHDPWSVLRRIRARLKNRSSVVSCIPNAQHWSVQARLNCGIFRYAESGLMDRTHIRWFTRQTIEEMFQTCGYRLDQVGARVVDEPHREAALLGIRAMAEAIGTDVERAVSDAIPYQWLVRAVPVQ